MYGIYSRQLLLDETDARVVTTATRPRTPSRWFGARQGLTIAAHVGITADIQQIVDEHLQAITLRVALQLLSAVPTTLIVGAVITAQVAECPDVCNGQGLQ